MVLQYVSMLYRVSNVFDVLNMAGELNELHDLFFYKSGLSDLSQVIYRFGCYGCGGGMIISEGATKGCHQFTEDAGQQS